MNNEKIDLTLIKGMEDNLCAFDHFKLFIPGEDAVKYLIANAAAFELKGQYSVHNNEQYKLPLTGSTGEEYKLRVSALFIKNLGEGVQLSGSFPRFYGTESSCYTWREFAQTIEDIIKVIPADPAKVLLINLGVALCFQIPVEMNTSVRTIIANILRFKGKTNTRVDMDHHESGYSLQFLLSEYIYKIENKTLKGNPGQHINIRFSMEIKKSAYLKDRGIMYLSDLFNAEHHFKLLTELEQNLHQLVFYQNEVDNELLLEEEKVYCKSYNTRQAWETLHQRDVHKYKYVKRKLEEVIDRVAPYSYKKNFQQAFNDALEAQQKKTGPDFPLCVEKREMPEIMNMIAMTTTRPAYLLF
ncbi:MAG: hypothetical protein JWQ09_3197 [Segetibacter sp.]|nr:hypothetical protein [Segetibacter sp.]